MSSQLSSVPVAHRRRSAAAAGVIAVVLVAVGVVPWASPAPAGVRAVATVALVGAALLGLVAWGLLASVGADTAEARLDAAIASTVASAVAEAGGGFDCGHEHDPDEMHVTDACASGPACTHDCAACLLSAHSRSSR